ncbi:methyltransferase type 11 [Candidatus Nitrosotenuis sp. DW1]|nr:methyltransferase type 11 [Candidatus Nitrosotenuis sp. DW1]
MCSDDIIKGVAKTIENLTKSKKLTHLEYKKRLIKIWNEVAPRYHERWAKYDIGPFRSSSELVKLADIRPGHMVLDLACGTGAITKRIAAKVGSSGTVVGVDSSISAIKIAKKEINNKTNLDFVLSDAEFIKFNKKFDVVTCQYALFFFPKAGKVLRNIKQYLKKNGTLALTLHGNKDTVPYFSSILDVVEKFIPDYVPQGTPNLDRFGTSSNLKKTISASGFTDIRILEYTFTYRPGTFSDYWQNYLKYLAKPLKEKIKTLSAEQRGKMKDQIKQNTLPYTKKSGQIVFPWKILILTAKKP